MSTSTSGGKDPFISNLNKIYAGYTGGFLCFVVILGILEQMGVPDRVIGQGCSTLWDAEEVDQSGEAADGGAVSVLVE